MKIRDMILMLFVLCLLVNSVILISIVSSRVNKISDVTSSTSSTQLKGDANKNLLGVAIGLRESLDSQLKDQYTLVKTWAKDPIFLDTAKDAQSYTSAQLYEKWSASSTRKYDSDNQAIGDGNPENDLNPAASKYMIELSKVIGVFPELFFTDKNGYAIGASVATGDFDQGPQDLRIILTDGVPVLKSFKPAVGGEGWYAATNAATEGFYVSDVAYDESSGTWGLEIVSQLKDQDTGAYLGQLKAVFDYGLFVKGFVNTEELGVDEIQIIDNKGNVAADSDNEDEDGTNELQKVDAVFLAEIQKGQKSGVITRTDDEGVEVVTAYAVSNDKNHHIVAVSKRLSDVDAPIDSFVASLKGAIDSDGKALISNIIVIALILAVVILAVAFYVINSKISTPIKKLTVASGKLAKGELQGLEFETKGDDEISKLGQGFQGVIAAFNLLNDELSKDKGHSKSEERKEKHK